MNSPKNQSPAMLADDPKVSFLGIELMTSPGVLVPRLETELLAREAIRRLAAECGEAPCRVIDMCCGSGNLACAVAAHLRNTRVWACDCAAPSVDLCCRNVKYNDLTDRVTVHQGDLFDAVSDCAIDGCCDAIICNPPYISEKRLMHGDRQELLRREPREAFDGGPFGLVFHQRMIREAPAFLKGDGLLLFEFGTGQHAQVARLFERSDWFQDLQFASDHNDIPRVAIARRRDRRL